MSPQSRATIGNATFAIGRDDAVPANACPGASSSVAEIARTANAEYALHKIESEGSAAAPLANQDSAGAPTTLRKRSAACISTNPENQPFLSSYGSAFLSGIFADIAHAEDGEESRVGSAAVPAYGADQPAEDPVSIEPCNKKARTLASTCFGRSYAALSGLVEGTDGPSAVVSPRPKGTSTNNAHKIHVSNDQVRELQDMAFPSLPEIPITVSSSSCSTASYRAVLTPRALVMGDAVEDIMDGPSYGWFVSTDGVDADVDENEPSAPTMFLPDTKPDLAFMAITAPDTGNQDLEVQQALAADTIDDVLGDLF